MKKCASCTKDLPDAALHCVFCGAKQPPAPAVQQQGLAKTAFGYSANDLIDQVRGRPLPPAAPSYNPPPTYNPPPAPIVFELFKRHVCHIGLDMSDGLDDICEARNRRRCFH